MAGILSNLFGKKNNMETTGATSSEPWLPAQPYLKGILSSADATFRQQEARKNDNWRYNAGALGIDKAAAETPGIINGALAPVQAVASGAAGINTEGDYRGVLAQAGQPGAAENYLTRTASGDYLDNGDPYLNDILADTNAHTTTALQDIYSGAGRYGGATMNRDIADRRFANEAGARSANYQNERDRQMAAANSIEGAQQGRIGLQGGILNSITGVQGQNINNRMGAAAMIPALADARFMGADRQLALGQEVEDRPWRNLQRYASLVGGAGGAGGTQTTSAPEEPFWKKALGALSGGLGIWGALTG